MKYKFTGGIVEFVFILLFGLIIGFVLGFSVGFHGGYREGIEITSHNFNEGLSAIFEGITVSNVILDFNETEIIESMTPIIERQLK